MFGVLRPEYREWTNTAAEFTRRKISVVPHANGDPWALTAERCEVLLPRGADDRLLDPQALLNSVDQDRPHDRNSLLTYVTISEPGTQRLHEQWSRAHACPFPQVATYRGKGNTNDAANFTCSAASDG